MSLHEQFFETVQLLAHSPGILKTGRYPIVMSGLIEAAEIAQGGGIFPIGKCKKGHALHRSDKSPPGAALVADPGQHAPEAHALKPIPWIRRDGAP